MDINQFIQHIKDTVTKQAQKPVQPPISIPQPLLQNIIANLTKSGK